MEVESKASANKVLGGSPFAMQTVTSTYVDSSVCSTAACGQNTTGTAANLSGTPALPNGTTATTQTSGDNTTKIATDAFVIANAGSATNTTQLSGTDTSSTGNVYTVPTMTTGTCPGSFAALKVGTIVSFIPHAVNTVVHPTLDICGFASPQQIWVYGDAGLQIGTVGVGHP
jgi:hypothetical protein